MKKMLFLALALGSANIHAVCPPNINGGWSGSIVKTSSTLVTNADGSNLLPGSVTNAVLTLNIAGASGVSNYYVEAEDGFGNKPDESTTPHAFVVAYNKNSCQATITHTDGGTIYFTVSNNGKTMKGVTTQSDSGSFGDTTFKSGTTELWVLDKQ